MGGAEVILATIVSRDPIAATTIARAERIAPSLGTTPACRWTHRGTLAFNSSQHPANEAHIRMVAGEARFRMGFTTVGSRVRLTIGKSETRDYSNCLDNSQVPLYRATRDGVG
jgi:hypothetical protein